jgi:hypothetical protein
MPIHGYPGNVITANPVAPTSTVATGVWTTEQQLKAVAAGNWPTTIPAQQISRSLRFNNADSANLTFTPGSAATSSQKFTLSFWVKRTNLSTDGAYIYGNGTTSGAADAIGFNTSDQLNFEIRGTNDGQLITTQVFRDVSSWYHIVYSVDTTQATASNRIKVYVNGVQITAFGTASYPSQNYNFVRFNQNTYIQYIGFIRGGASSIYYLNGYLAEIYDIDGQALTPSSFGQTNTSTGVWEPIAYTGTYGTNGFYLNFSDNSGTTSTTLGADTSGNGNNWTPNNFSVTAGAGNDSLVDSPTSYGTDTGVGGEVRGNYCTWNPIDRSGASPTNGNLEIVNDSGTKRVTIPFPSSGKWYWEQLAGSNTNVGICDVTSPVSTQPFYSTTYAKAYYNNGTLYTGGAGSTGSWGATYTSGDIIGGLFDATVSPPTLSFYKNNVLQGSTITLNSGVVYAIAAGIGGAGVETLNCGQRPFAYTAPSGAKALCTTNLPTPTIGATSTTQANDYFNTVLYTGNGSTQSITGVGFQPDWVWAKSRSNAANHRLFDAVRGASKILYSSLTNAEATDASGLTSFDTNGFSIGSTQVNDSGQTYVAWNWNAGGSNATNTSGTITSTVRANTTSGFSIVTYTGTGANATVGHGLGVAPSMIVIKERGNADNWAVYHVSVGNQRLLNLNSTNAQSGTSAAYWNNTTPTSTVFSVGTDNKTNGSNAAGMICYAFAPVAGYSAFGSYVGNGSSDGPFVFLNFRPRYVMMKRTDSTSDWAIHDAARNTYNTTNSRVWANSSSAEVTSTYDIDFLSNGFKFRTSSHNESGGTYIYMALAENPFKYSLGR